MLLSPINKSFSTQFSISGWYMFLTDTFPPTALKTGWQVFVLSALKEAIEIEESIFPTYSNNVIIEDRLVSSSLITLNSVKTSTKKNAFINSSKYVPIWLNSDWIPLLLSKFIMLDFLWNDLRSDILS